MGRVFYASFFIILYAGDRVEHLGAIIYEQVNERVFYFVLDGRDAPAHARARGRSKDGASGGWLTAEAFLAISCF